MLITECDVVGTANDGRQAFEAARELNPGVVVHDITMPVLNGIEAARRLKGAAVEARNVFLTVHDDHQDYSGKVMKEVKRAT